MAKALTKAKVEEADATSREGEAFTSVQNQRDMNDPELTSAEAVAKNLAEQSDAPAEDEKADD